MKVSKSGRVTIPRQIRERLGIVPGVQIEIEIVGTAIRIRLAEKGLVNGKRIVEAMRGRATLPMSTNEILSLTRPDQLT